MLVLLRVGVKHRFYFWKKIICLLNNSEKNERSVFQFNLKLSRDETFLFLVIYMVSNLNIKNHMNQNLVFETPLDLNDCDERNKMLKAP